MGIKIGVVVTDGFKPGGIRGSDVFLHMRTSHDECPCGTWSIANTHRIGGSWATIRSVS